MKIIYYHEPFSKKVIIGKLIISYSFWQSSYLTGGISVTCSYCGCEFDVETDVSI